MEADHALIDDLYRQARALGACDAIATELARQCGTDLFPWMPWPEVERLVEAATRVARGRSMPFRLAAA